MRMVALSEAEIKALPDNLNDAVKAGKHPAAFNPQEPDRPFLPNDLFVKDSPWVVVSNAFRTDSLGAPEHLAAVKGRSVFTVFIRLPAGRKATEQFVGKLQAKELPDLPEGTRTALLRRVLLIDDRGALRPTTLTESLQIRVYWKSLDGRPFAFKLRRGDLFAGRSGGLQPINLKGHNCHSCHARIDDEGVRTSTIASLYVGGPRRRGLEVSDLEEQGQQTIAWVGRTYTWGLIQGLWESQPGK
jgi:hypothetical protein